MTLKVIHSTQTVLPSGVEEAYIAIKNGKIDAIQGTLPEGTLELVEVGNQIVMAGVIDPHVHINEPGRTEWEGFQTATHAAIAGGITTLVDMPLNSSPVTTTVAAFEEKLAAASGKLHTNVGFWGGVVPGNTHEIEPLIKKGVLGFKAFLTHSGIDDFPNATEADLDAAMPIIAKYQLPLLVHCELSDNIQRAQGTETSYQNYLSSRPQAWEVKAIEMMIRLCEKHQCRVHIVHLSAADAIPMLVEAKQKGLPITVETGQHYLFFDAESIPDGQTAYKCAPPIREKANNDKLWNALADGIINFVATDHSPATPNLKELSSGNLMKAWGGIASIQLALPVLWTAAQKRGYSVQHLSKWLCSQPAAFIGKGEQKGQLKQGYDADIVVFDADAQFEVTGNILHHRHKISPYIGQTLKGVVTQTWLGGQQVFCNGQLIHQAQGNTILL